MPTTAANWLILFSTSTILWKFNKMFYLFVLYIYRKCSPTRELCVKPFLSDAQVLWVQFSFLTRRQWVQFCLADTQAMGKVLLFWHAGYLNSFPLLTQMLWVQFSFSELRLLYSFPFLAPRLWVQVSFSDTQAMGTVFLFWLRLWVQFSLSDGQLRDKGDEEKSWSPL
jgi:hypothetical protein